MRYINLARNRFILFYQRPGGRCVAEVGEIQAAVSDPLGAAYGSCGALKGDFVQEFTMRRAPSVEIFGLPDQWGMAIEKDRKHRTRATIRNEAEEDGLPAGD